ncbi:unnamed protein product [Parajaminaea phylloscopi]
MWAGFKARLKSLGREDAEAQERNHQARLERKAKRAAKTISKNANRELLEWEQKHGYHADLPPASLSSRAPTASSSQTVLEPAQPPFHRRSISAVKTLSDVGTLPSIREKNGGDDPVISPSLTEAPSVAPTLHVVSTDGPGFGFELPQLVKPADGHAEQQSSHVSSSSLQDKEALLQEIQAIRARINSLRSGAPDLTIDTTQLRPERSSSSPGTASRPRASSTHGRQAPWLTPDRSPRPVSMVSPTRTGNDDASYFPTPTTPTTSARRNRRKSVADLFAGDVVRDSMAGSPDTGFPHNATPTTPYLPHLDLNSGDATTNQVANSSHSRAARPRTKSSSSTPSRSPVLRSTTLPDIAPPLPANATEIARSNRLSRGLTSTSQFEPPRPDSALQVRQIVDAPEEAKKRLSAALGRSPQPQARHQIDAARKQPKRRSTHAGDAAISALTMAELQERHQAKLRELQGPANLKVAEAHALAQAKAEWEKKLLAEKKEQERKAKERAKAAAAAASAGDAPSKARVVDSFRRRTMSADVLPQVPTYQSLHNVDLRGQGPVDERDAALSVHKPDSTRRDPLGRSTKRHTGAQRASEWRQSMISESRSSTLSPPDNIDSAALQPQFTRRPPAAAAAENHALDKEAGTPARARRQSTLGLSRPDPSAREPLAARDTGNVPRLDPSLNRPHTILVTGSTSMAEFGQIGKVPASTAPRAGSRRQMTATDLRRIKEGAGRLSQPSPSALLDYERFHPADPMMMPSQPRSLQTLAT